MNSETRQCQNCKNSFVIEPDDFAFYEKIKVPAPTWCSKCRLIRRLSWHGYRILYKRLCDYTGTEMISTHHTTSPHKVYKQEVWWSDAWDPKEYGKEYDPNRPFLEQFHELMLAVPLPSLHTEYSRLVNSEYCNAATDLKNCYLVFRTTNAEDAAYLNMIVDAKQCFDVSYANFIELCYDSVELQKCYQTFYSQDCENSHHIWFSRDLVGCSYCIGCSNLRNKNYYIFNQPYTKEEYEKKTKEFNFGSHNFVKEFKSRVAEFLNTQPYRNFHGIKNNNVSGDYIYNSRNVHNSYMVRNADNVRYSQFLKNGPTANCYDYSIFSDGAEWVYESCWVGLNTNNVKFSLWNYRCHDIEYCFACMGSSNCFGCVGIRKGEYCILNKQYSKEEYHIISDRIKKQMQDIPYIDSIGREYKYGEFIPNEFCPWRYNESVAHEWWPLIKEDALRLGFGWRDDDGREYREASMKVPDDIKDVGDEILKAILKCESCQKNYLLIPLEVSFYQRFQIPIPRTCALCRDRERVRRLHPIENFIDKCSKCDKEISSPYPRGQGKVVYCEQCYNAEVV